MTATTTRGTLEAISRIVRGPAPTNVIADTQYTFEIGDPSGLTAAQRLMYGACIVERLASRSEQFVFSQRQVLAAYVGLMLSVMPAMKGKVTGLTTTTITLTAPDAGRIAALDAATVALSDRTDPHPGFTLPGVLGMASNDRVVQGLQSRLSEQALMAVFSLLTHAIFKEYIDQTIGGVHAGERVFAKARPEALIRVANLTPGQSAWLSGDEATRPSKWVFMGINRLFSTFTELRRKLMEEFVEWQRVTDPSLNRRIILTTIQLGRWSGIGFVGHVRDLHQAFPQLETDIFTSGEWARFRGDSAGVAGILPFTQRFLGAINGPALPIWRRGDYPALVTLSTLYAMARGEKTLRNFRIFPEYKAQAVAVLARWGFTIEDNNVDVIEIQ